RLACAEIHHGRAPLARRREKGRGHRRARPRSLSGIRARLAETLTHSRTLPACGRSVTSRFCRFFAACLFLRRSPAYCITDFGVMMPELGSSGEQGSDLARKTTKA